MLPPSAHFKMPFTVSVAPSEISRVPFASTISVSFSPMVALCATICSALLASRGDASCVPSDLQAVSVIRRFARISTMIFFMLLQSGAGLDFVLSAPFPLSINKTVFIVERLRFS